MEFTITAAAIATLISAATSATITLLISRTNKIKHLDDQLDDILKIAVQYPYLESKSFTSTWNDKKDTEAEEYLRYDLYCTLLFNYLSRLSKHFKYDKDKIDGYVAAKDWVRLHKDYWNNPYEDFENIDSYDKKFKELIAEYLK